MLNKYQKLKDCKKTDPYKMLFSEFERNVGYPPIGHEAIVSYLGFNAYVIASRRKMPHSPLGTPYKTDYRECL